MMLRGELGHMSQFSLPVPCTLKWKLLINAIFDEPSILIYGGWHMKQRKTHMEHYFIIILIKHIGEIWSLKNIVFDW